MRRRHLLGLAIAVVMSLGAVTLAVANPGVTACLIIDLAPFDTLADGTRIERGSTHAELADSAELVSQGRARIEKTFGTPRADPIIVVFHSPKAFWPLRLNSYGSTQFVGPRACVLIGPGGQNVDVTAHELLLVELWHRVGAWRRFFIPTWFDEGVAMQVDHRPAYTLPVAPENGTASVRGLNSPAQFYRGDDAQLTRNYAFAKAEVAVWLARVGVDQLYPTLERIQAGQSVDDALAY
jgi:hypothetical protein